MASQVELRAVITALDQTKSGVNSAANNLKGLSAQAGKMSQAFSVAAAAAAGPAGLLTLIPIAAQKAQDMLDKINPVEWIKKWDAAADSVKKFGDQIISQGKNLQWLGRQLTFNLTVPIIGFATLAVSQFGKVEDSLMRTAAAFGITANKSDESFKKVQDAIITVTKNSIVPMEQLSDAMYELASAGMDVDEAISALPQVTRLIEVAAIDAGDAVSYAVRMTSLWADQGYDMGKILDITAVAVQRSTAHFSDFTHNIEMSAQFAMQAGLNYEELSSAVAVLSNRGAPLARIGFNISQMFSQMISPSAKARDALGELEVKFYHVVDGITKMKPMTQVLGEIGDAMRTKWPKNLEKQAKALNDIFNIRAGRAALSLVDPKGLEDLKEFEALLTSGNIEGALKRMDELMQADPWYQWQKAINTGKAALYQLGQTIIEMVVPYVKFLVDKFNDLVTWLTNLDPVIKKFIGGFILVLAVIGPLLIAFGTMFELFGLLISSIGAILSPLGLLITIIGTTAIIAIASFVYNYVSGFGSAKEAVENLRNKVVEWWNTMKAAWKSPEVQEAIKNVKDAIRRVGEAVSYTVGWLVNGGGLRDSLNDQKTPADTLAGILNTVADALEKIAYWIKLLPPFVTALKSDINDFAAAFERLANAIGGVIKGTSVGGLPGAIIGGAIGWNKPVWVPFPMSGKQEKGLTSTVNEMLGVPGMSGTANQVKGYQSTQQVAEMDYAKGLDGMNTIASEKLAITDQTFTTAWTTIGAGANTFLTNLVNSFILPFQNILTTVQTTFQGISNFISNMASTSIEVINGFVNSVIQFFVNLSSNLLGSIIPGIVNGVIAWFSSLPAGITKAMAGVASAISKPFKDGINAVVEYWNKHIAGKGFTMPKWLGGASWKIPYLEAGGMIPMTGLYMMHKGERVIPEGSHTQTGGEITVNAYFYGNINESGGDLGDIGKKLARSLELAHAGIT